MADAGLGTTMHDLHWGMDKAVEHADRTIGSRRAALCTGADPTDGERAHPLRMEDLFSSPGHVLLEQGRMPNVSPAGGTAKMRGTCFVHVPCSLLRCLSTPYTGLQQPKINTRTSTWSNFHL